MNNAAIRNELEQFSSHHVRSLYWLLFSTSPIKMDGVEGVPLFPEEWIAELKTLSKQYFHDLDQDPEPLVLFLSKGNTYRLGMYAERILCFFFDTFSETELVLHNFQIFDQKVTIGEVDFIIRFLGRTIHIELATKYYLATKCTNDFKEWVGPSGKDSLHRKLKKVKELQLPITGSELFKSQTKLASVESYFLLRGHFYTPDSCEPKWKNPNASFGRYFFLDDFIAKYKKAPSQYFFLWKPNWMSAIEGVLAEQKRLRAAEYDIAETINREGHVLVLDLVTNAPFFVVRNDWPD